MRPILHTHIIINIFHGLMAEKYHFLRMNFFVFENCFSLSRAFLGIALDAFIHREYSDAAKTRSRHQLKP